MKTSKQSIENIVSQKTFAVAGVSRNGKKFGNATFNELKNKGLKVYPINPNMNEIEGVKCFASVKDLPERPGALILCVKPSETERIVREASDSGIQNIWMQNGSGSKEAVKFCVEKNINVVNNECIMMFLQPVEGFHKFHRFVNKIFGKVPS